MEPYMSDFKRDEPMLYRIFECTLSLSSQESEVYLALQMYPDTSVDELAKCLGKNVSGLNRTLKALMQKGLVRRKCCILKHGGYKYFYFPIPIEQIIPRIMEMISDWIVEVDSIVDSFSLKLEEKRFSERMSAERHLL